MSVFSLFVNSCCQFKGVLFYIRFLSYDVFWYLGQMVFSISIQSFCTTHFFLSKPFAMSTTVWVWCSLEETRCAQIGMSHCSQKGWHTFDKCFWHLVVDLRPSHFKKNNFVFFRFLYKMFPTQAVHICMWQLSQYRGQAGVLQRWHRNTSWALCWWSMVKELDNCTRSWKYI